MVNRLFSVCCLSFCLAVLAGEAAARDHRGPPARVFAADRDDADEARRLRELRMKEAIRYGDVSPEEARSRNRDYRRFAPGGPSAERDDDRGYDRKRWRDAQRRALEDDHSR
ncbi:hypothetical protein [Crenobacter luteus]|uniref:hypothetical protein n=1 Tax=Crenobacter luteus TaxID=1452487 RepID=UPI0012E88D43|nr:hypothetical protein [Crenobacter luteus]